MSRRISGEPPAPVHHYGSDPPMWREVRRHGQTYLAWMERWWHTWTIPAWTEYRAPDEVPAATFGSSSTTEYRIEKIEHPAVTHGESGWREA